MFAKLSYKLILDLVCESNKFEYTKGNLDPGPLCISAHDSVCIQIRIFRLTPQLSDLTKIQIHIQVSSYM